MGLVERGKAHVLWFERGIGGSPKKDGVTTGFWFRRDEKQWWFTQKRRGKIRDLWCERHDRHMAFHDKKMTRHEVFDSRHATNDVGSVDKLNIGDIVTSVC